MYDDSTINDGIIPLTNPDQAELDKHAIIEASAGTGKTYTIEQLVVRLLIGNPDVNPPVLPIPIDRILVVTFTEKATGEMKDRIRNTIEAKLNNAARSDTEWFYLHDALENFDNAQISTIHGFCHRTLREHAFENGRQFEYDVVDDRDIYHTLLLRQMREDWPKHYGRNLCTYLLLADFPHRVQNESQWIDTTIKLAQNFRPNAGDQLYPEPDATVSPMKTVSELKQYLSELVMVIGGFPINSVTDHPFYGAYSRLNFNAGSKNLRLKNVITPLLELLDHFREKKNDILDSGTVAAMIRLIRDNKKTSVFAESGFACLMPKKWNKDKNNLDAECPHLQSIINPLEQIRELTTSFAPQFRSQVVKQLQTDVRLYKEQKGLLTYNDMISMVAAALSGNHGTETPPPLLSALRDRYKIALIDEFQDTDILQWSILKTVFVDKHDDSPHRLIVVGDPKQAIYGFRGADLNAYYLARNQLGKLGKTKTGCYSLDTNWRSIPQLIDAFNALFKHDNWFQRNDIRHQPANTPTPGSGRNRLYRDNTGSSVLITHSINSDKSAKAAQAEWFKFIAAEIDRLLNSSTEMMMFGDKTSPPRPLRADDICILCQNKTEAGRIEKELNNTHIPYSFYKKPGLYESDEALQLLYLLEAIASPNDTAAFKKLLMTCFFAIPVLDVKNYENLPSDHCIKRLFLKWVRHAANRQWAIMFHSIRNETRILLNTGNDPDHERRLTNIEQIIQELHNRALTENMDIIDLANLLGNLYYNHISISEEDNLHRRDTEHPGVQMTTIHKSKGLEFPVVFIAGGMTAPPNTNQPYYKIHNGEHVIYDLTSKSKSQWENEQHEELQRLYYVALTRAIYKLYIPHYRNEKQLNASGSVAKILYPAINAAAGELPAAPVITDRIDISNSEWNESRMKVIQLDPAIELPRNDFNLRDRNRSQSIDSYSGLKNKMLPHAPAKFQNISNQFGDDQAEEPAADESSQTTQTRTMNIEAADPIQKTGLPPGRLTGNLLHNVFESLDFQLAGSTAGPKELLQTGTAEVIKKSMNHYQLPAEHDDQLKTIYHHEISKIIWTTLNVELPGGIKLRDISECDRKHELEFFFPYPQLSNTDIPNINRCDGFVKGYIDLIFRCRNKYYILDWKSDSLDDYSPDQLEHHMCSNYYDLQYKLYTIATDRWLQQYHQTNQLAGVFYLFLRGLKTGTHSGIFPVIFKDQVPPTQEYENELDKLIQT